MIFMRKIITIAVREYRAMVGTKAFLFSIIMMPVLMMGSLFAIELMRNAIEIHDRKIAVIDHSGEFVELLIIEANQKNLSVDQGMGNGFQSEGESEDARGDLLGGAFDRYFIERISPEEASDEFKSHLSDRIRDQDLYAFVEIPADISSGASEMKIRFYSQDSSLSVARSWLSTIINTSVREARFASAGIDPGAVAEASIPIEVVGMGLVDRASDGGFSAEEENDPMNAIFLPMSVMMMMFMVIFMAAQPMLESVLEEKSQRIAEVLLGSVNPFQLMSGKLLGTVGGSLTVFVIYMIGAFGLACWQGYLDQIPFHLAPWFVVFQITGVLFYSAIFMAIGASVSQLKEAQSMLLPVWMLMMSPMFVWLMVVRDPLGVMPTYFSFFPPATPTVMMLRLATGQAIPWWQPVASILIMTVSTILIVIVAARIFRVGILWQGKTPKLREILRWAVTG
jgi:ABC-2 type transport system permease protein